MLTSGEQTLLEFQRTSKGFGVADYSQGLVSTYKESAGTHSACRNRTGHVRLEGRGMKVHKVMMLKMKAEDRCAVLH